MIRRGCEQIRDVMEASDIPRYPSVNLIDFHLHMTATQVVLSPHKCHGCPCIRHTVASPWAIAKWEKGNQGEERARAGQCPAEYSQGENDVIVSWRPSQIDKENARHKLIHCVDSSTTSSGGIDLAALRCGDIKRDYSWIRVTHL